MTNHTHTFSDWPFDTPVNTISYCTAKIAQAHFPVLYVVHDWDGDWQFLDETPDDPGDCVLMCMGCVLEQDPTLSEVADLPVGWGARRSEVGGSWTRCQEAPDEDEECEDVPLR